MYARLGTTSKVVSEIQAHEMEKFQALERRLRRMEAMVKAIANSPGRRIGTATDRGTITRVGTIAQGEDTRPATLCRNPRLLSTLWDEYLNGIGGRLPAQQFNRTQRGRVRGCYSFRKPFWMCMQRLVDKGYTDATALNKIERVYEGSVSEILRQLAKDERMGGHHYLCPNRVSSS